MADNDLLQVKLRGEDAALFRQQAEAATRPHTHHARYLLHKERDNGWEPGDFLLERRTFRLNEDYEVARHPDDPWFDEVHLVDKDGPLLRLRTTYRYKTSGISGDEWRTGTIWQAHRRVPLRGDWNLDARDEDWGSFHGGFGSMEAGYAALYPGLYTSQSQLHDWKILEVRFRRKGRTLYTMTHNGKPLPLLACSAHLPWAAVCASDESTGSPETASDGVHLCSQSGCHEPAVSTYRLKRLFNGAGESTPARTLEGRGLVRRFCPLHLRRGDCGLEDADSNYEVLDGPGPSEAIGWRAYESPARLVTLELSGGDL